MPHNLKIYLDHAASTPVRSEVLDKHEELARTYFINPHGSSTQSEEAYRSVCAAEQELLSRLNISHKKAEVLWTSGGTESTNLACLGSARQQGNGGILVESTGHSAIIEPCRQAAAEAALPYTEIPVDKSGQLQLDALEGTDTASAQLIAVCHVNSETGVVQDLERLREWMDLHAPHAVLMVDAAQSFGKLPVPWQQAHIDFVATGGRKIGAPPSTGALIKRRDANIAPLFFGGDQQRGLRPGTLDTVGIHEFLTAARKSIQEQDAEFERIKSLNTTLRQMVTDELSPFNPRIISPVRASPYVLAITFPGYEGSILMRTLAEKGIVVGTGSACVSESRKAGYVLRAMGWDESTTRGMLRISFGKTNTSEQIPALIEELHNVLQNY